MSDYNRICSRCGNQGYTSIWQWRNTTGEVLTICTGCANELRGEFSCWGEMNIILSDSGPLGREAEEEETQQSHGPLAQK